MAVVNARVEDCHDDIAASRRDVPRLWRMNVGAGNAAGLSGVVQAP